MLLLLSLLLKTNWKLGNCFNTLHNNCVIHIKLFIIIVNQERPFDIVISFDDSMRNEVYFGIYLESQKMFSLKGNLDDDPMQFQVNSSIYNQFEKSKEHKPTELARVIRDFTVRDGAPNHPGYFWHAMRFNIYEFALERLASKIEIKYLSDEVNTFR